jgi:hypothetical protein
MPMSERVIRPDLPMIERRYRRSLSSTIVSDRNPIVVSLSEGLSSGQLMEANCGPGRELRQQITLIYPN